jgi:hypothetical protein
LTPAERRPRRRRTRLRFEAHSQLQAVEDVVHRDAAACGDVDGRIEGHRGARGGGGDRAGESAIRFRSSVIGDTDVPERLVRAHAAIRLAFR